MALLVLSVGPLFSAETAYKALGVARAKLSDSGLRNLIELKGERGGDQPQAWTLLFNDPSARGGIREVVVSNGEITSERTPLGGFSGTGSLPTIQLNRLNLDSNKAFQIANQAAITANVGFHWVNYTMRADVDNTMPIWVVELVDYMGAPVGTIYISAETGTVTRRLQLESGREAATQASSGSATGGAIGEVENFTKRTATGVKNVTVGTANTVKDGTLRVVGNVQEWLTGSRTIGPPVEE